MNYTPGPWRAELDACTGCGQIVSNLSDSYFGQIIAIIRDANSDCELLTYERKANAYLIATAPELLEALEDIVDWISVHDKATEKYNRAKAAINKAKGEY